MKRELFGPILPVLAVPSLDEACDMVRTFKFQTLIPSPKGKLHWLHRQNPSSSSFREIILQIVMPYFLAKKNRTLKLHSAGPEEKRASASGISLHRVTRFQEQVWLSSGQKKSFAEREPLSVVCSFAMLHRW
jgi:hypothetical protein